MLTLILIMIEVKVLYYFFYNVFDNLSVANADMVALIITAVTAVLLSIVSRLIARIVLTMVIRRLHKVREKKWAAIMLANRLPKALSNLAVPFVLVGVLQGLIEENWFLDKLVSIIVLLVSLLLFNTLIHMCNDLYTQLEVSKTKPIKGFLQVVQVVFYVIFTVIAVATLLDKNPLALLGGVGAAAAVVSFVFQDPILGFVAGIQLSANDMVRIGDWIEMPKYSADGLVAEISMITVKVRNFDNSITNIPAKAMVNDAFINWRGMTESGGRRIKRAICIDAASVRFCDEKMMKRFEEIELIRDYIQFKEKEIAGKEENVESPKDNDSTGDAEKFNDSEIPQPSSNGKTPKLSGVNNRRLTNLGTFRAYMAAYIKSCPDLRGDTKAMVRQLPAEGIRIPLEVYAYTTTTDWDEYEIIQSDLFDHFYSVLPVFDLKV